MGLTQKLGTIPLAIQTDSSNNVGIGGAANASYKLAVTGASLFTGAGTFNNAVSLVSSAPTLNLSSTSATGINEIYFNRNTSSLIGYMAVGVNSTITGSGDEFIIDNRASGGGLIFRTNNAGTSAARMTITGAGNVGIGTSTTSAKTEIRGNGNTAINSAGTLFVTTGGTATQAAEAGGQLTFGAWLNGDLSVPYPVAAIKGVSESSATDTNKGALIFATMNNTTNAERMRITSAGNVCIGTSTSTGYGNINLDLNAGALPAAYFIIKTNSGGVIAEYALDGGAAYLSTKTYHSLNIRTNDTLRMQVYPDGYIAMNSVVYGTTTAGTTRTLYISGSNSLIGGIASIRASKKNIENASNVEWLYQLNPVTFNYRKKDEDGNYTEETYEDLNYGLIAEDTAPIADFLINYNDKEDGTKEMVGIEYPRLITPLLKAIQDQKKLIDELSAKVTALENK